MKMLTFFNFFALILIAVETRSQLRQSYVVTHQYGGETVPITVELDFDQQTEYVISLNSTTTGRSITFYDFKKRIIAYKDLTARQCFLAHMTDETLAKEQRMLEKVKHDAVLISPSSVTLYTKNHSLPVNTLLNLAGKRVARFCNGISAFVITNGKKYKKRSKRNTNEEKGQFVHHAYGHYGHQSTNYAHYGHETYTSSSMQPNGKRTQLVRQYQISGSDTDPAQSGADRQGEVPTRKNGLFQPFGLAGMPGGRGQFSLQTSHDGGYQIDQPLGIKAGSSYRGGVRSQGQYGVGLGKQPYLHTVGTYPKPPPGIDSRIPETVIKVDRPGQPLAPGQIQPSLPAVRVQQPVQPRWIPSPGIPEIRYPSVRQPVPGISRPDIGTSHIGLPDRGLPGLDVQHPQFPISPRNGLPHIRYPDVKDTRVPPGIPHTQLPGEGAIQPGIQHPSVDTHISPYPGISTGIGDARIPSGIPSIVPSVPLSPESGRVTGDMIPDIPGRQLPKVGTGIPHTQFPGGIIAPSQIGIGYPSAVGIQPGITHVLPGRIDQQPISPRTIPGIGYPGGIGIQPGITHVLPGRIDQQPISPGIIPARIPGIPAIHYPDGRVQPREAPGTITQRITPDQIPSISEQPGFLPLVPSPETRVISPTMDQSRFLLPGGAPGQLLPGTIPSTILQPPDGIPGTISDVRYPRPSRDRAYPSITAVQPGAQIPVVTEGIPGTPAVQLPLVGPRANGGFLPPTYGEGLPGLQDGEGGAASQTQVQTSAEQTSAQAKSSGHIGGLGSQTQVQGSHSGNGSFSAQAQAGFIRGDTQSQVRGGRLGGAAGSGANVNNVGSAQSQVQTNQPSGSSSSSAQGRFLGGLMQVQAQGGKDSGNAAAQAQSSGLSSSQSQVNVAGREVTERDTFQGGGSASAQGGLVAGNSQTQLQGGYSSGRTYSATAQSGFDSRGIRVSVPQHISQTIGATRDSVQQPIIQPQRLPGYPSTSLIPIGPGQIEVPQPGLPTPEQRQIHLPSQQLPRWPPSAITPGVSTPGFPSIPAQQPRYPTPVVIPSIPGRPGLPIPGEGQIQIPLPQQPSAITPDVSIPGFPSIPAQQPGYPTPVLIPSTIQRPGLPTPGGEQIQLPLSQQPGWPPSAIIPGISVPGFPSIPGQPGFIPSVQTPGRQIHIPQQPGLPFPAITPGISIPGIPSYPAKQPGYPSPSPGFIPIVPSQIGLPTSGERTMQILPPSSIIPVSTVPGFPSIPGLPPGYPRQIPWSGLPTSADGQIQLPLPSQPNISQPAFPSIPVQQPGYPTPDFISTVPGQQPILIPPDSQPGQPIFQKPGVIPSGAPSLVVNGYPSLQQQPLVPIPGVPSEPGWVYPEIPGQQVKPPGHLIPRPSCCEPKPKDRPLCCDSSLDLATRYACCDSRSRHQKERRQSCCKDHSADDDDGEECRVVKATCYIVYKSAGRARICRPLQTNGC